MTREEIEDLRKKVSCARVLETVGFAIDQKESTRRVLKFRRGPEIIIVTHEGNGWFDPLGEDKGDVFSLVARLDGGSFGDAISRIAELASFPLSGPRLALSTRARRLYRAPVAQRFKIRRHPQPGSPTWRYLSEARRLSATVLRQAAQEDVLREGPHGSMWAAHTDEAAVLCGWEERGPGWRGFAAGGTKVLFRFGQRDGLRLCVTESAIDAMSLAAIEGVREGTLYLSTGGGWSPNTDAALRTLARRSDAQLIAATDANPQGEAYAYRLRELAEEAGCNWLRLRPPADDWNEVLKQREDQTRGRGTEKRGVPHSRRSRQGKLRPAAPALDPAGRDGGGPDGGMKD
ncbi:hypothetical protein FHT86_007119 [Rhizobium sp. BK313]|uniref:DUF3991 and toprim domain-containing protein n=1 Tax=Rhizobium sp. BK313 TaxID=2587081 RepID=UPI00105D450B|nr:DUF3991 and toprim domain-containing protein [Rhizobium sp. BK313]MBB3458793.1 hypothetical protein [Rhizobium sp. BK313]